MNNLSPETAIKRLEEVNKYVRGDEAFSVLGMFGGCDTSSVIDLAIDAIKKQYLTPSVEGNSVENAREWYKRSVSNGDVGVYPMSGFMTEDVLLSMLTGYAQSLRPGGGWQIKELEWEYNGTHHDADTLFGLYWIMKHEGEIILHLSTSRLGEFDTIEQAKSAAFDDYAARIKTGLKEG